MTDWAGQEGTETARRYRLMAEQQLHGLSPSYERLCLGVADDPGLLARLDTLPRIKRQPNLLLAVVRYLDGPRADYTQFRAFVFDNWDEVERTLRARRTQTNEASRCATLLPLLAQLPQPLALLEVGTSAGLCLYPDRYAYRYDDRPALGDSSVVHECATNGRVPLPSALPTVVWRAGLDLNPLDVRSPDDRRWLKSLIWPEQRARFDTLRTALDVAAADPPHIVTGDLTTDTAALAAQAPASATLVLMHIAVLAYLDAAGREAFAQLRAEIAARRRVVWVANEAPGVVADVATPPGLMPFVLARDGAPVALTGPHGHFVHWLS